MSNFQDWWCRRWCRRHNQASRVRDGQIQTHQHKGVSSIKSLYLLQKDEIIEPSFVKNAPAVKGNLDVQHIKRDYNLEKVLFFWVLLFVRWQGTFPYSVLPSIKHSCLRSWKRKWWSERKHSGHCQKFCDGDSETWLQCPACCIWFHQSCFET